MPWKVSISSSAKADISDIKKWYKKQSALAAENFIEEIAASIDSLESDKIEHKHIYREYRRLLLTKFPYTIYYKRNSTNNTVEITAILHNKRDTGAIEERLYG